MPASISELVVLPIEHRILLIGGQKVMLDSDLAQLYGVPTGRLNEAVKRNRLRFPDDFMFQLTSEEREEVESLRSQIATLKRGQHRKYSPYAFTEQGIAMLSSVLMIERAGEVHSSIRALWGSCPLLSRSGRSRPARKRTAWAAGKERTADLDRV